MANDEDVKVISRQIRDRVTLVKRDKERKQAEVRESHSASQSAQQGSSSAQQPSQQQIQPQHKQSLQQYHQQQQYIQGGVGASQQTQHVPGVVNQTSMASLPSSFAYNISAAGQMTQSASVPHPGSDGTGELVTNTIIVNCVALDTCLIVNLPHIVLIASSLHGWPGRCFCGSRIGGHDERHGYAGSVFPTTGFSTAAAVILTTTGWKANDLYHC